MPPRQEHKTEWSSRELRDEHERADEPAPPRRVLQLSVDEVERALEAALACLSESLGRLHRLPLWSGRASIFQTGALPHAMFEVLGVTVGEVGFYVPIASSASPLNLHAQLSATKIVSQLTTAPATSLIGLSTRLVLTLTSHNRPGPCGGTL